MINLHTHLEGSVRPETAAELAAACGLPAPADGWRAAMELGRPADLTAFLARVALAYPLLGSPAALERTAYEAVLDAAADGCRYLELRFGPWTHATSDLGVVDIVRAVCRGVEAGRSDTGIEAGVVTAVLRHHSREANQAVLDAAVACIDNGVVGFDLAGDELLYPDLEPYVALFGSAAAAGLGVTCHAAEAAPAESARTAVQLLGVRRIGHGVRIVESPEVMSWVAREQVCLEVCPTSNWLTGAVASRAEHPVRQFVANGIQVAVGDDDPSVTGTRLSEEHAVLRDLIGLDDVQLAAVEATSLAVMFADDSVRDNVRRSVASATTTRSQ